MATKVQSLEQPIAARTQLGMRQKKRLLQIGALALMLVYSALTLFPFYVLFVRSFVGTKDAGKLFLWIPQPEPLSLTAQMGALENYYNLDVKKLKADLNIPDATYLPPNASLQEIAEQYNVPIKKMRDYFNGYYTFNGWITLLSGDKLWWTLARTIFVTAASLIGLIFLSVLTGYGLAGLRHRGQRWIYLIYTLQLVIPAMLVILPQFLLVQWLEQLIPGTDSPGTARDVSQLLTIVVLNIKGGAVSTMIFTAFIGELPRELEEAAFIDGASQWQYLRYVLFPLLKVPIISLVVIMLPIFWNDLLQPYIYLDQNNTMLMPFILNFAGNYDTKFQVIYAAIFVSVVPLAFIYLIFRRFFVEGVMAGAIKG
ncbi:MAG TPA: carbohydrate ABC transporter permease [Anaerolineae bacterium]|nr:carbohydrate ABC transporter permease [Anaerolineae bacterium]